MNAFDRLIIASKFFNNGKQSLKNKKNLNSIIQKKFETQKNPTILMKNLHNTYSCSNHEEVVDIVLKDESILDLISNCLDSESRRILSMLDTPQTPLALFNKLKIPTTSLYRKINRLQEDGLITHAGAQKINKSKSTLYVKTFDNITMQFGKTDSLILTMKRSVLENSIAYSTMLK
ncbi:MAG TPA: helix-turn-helix domain-containing protein [Candidatus Nitrosotenuis sp.]|nr:helix-turn-helix domain-containing protein [Candidatus Nitrosotenuis sp.]